MSNKSNQIKSNQIKSNQISNENKKFAIFITSYNYAEYISQAIESVINQSDPDWHLYIFDNCSTDNTEEIVKKYVEKDCRISWKKRDKNIGSIPNIISGFKEIDADYISTLQADDWLEPNFVTDAKKAFAENPEIPFCALGWKIFWNDKNTYQNYAIPFPEKFKSKTYLSPYLVFHNFIALHFLVFNKQNLLHILPLLENLSLRQNLEIMLIKHLETNFGASYFNNDCHGYWRMHSNQETNRNSKNNSQIEYLTEPFCYCNTFRENNLQQIATRFMSVLSLVICAGMPFRNATEWIFSDLGKYFINNFAHLDIDKLREQNLEKSLLCLAACVWSSFIFYPKVGGRENNLETAKQSLSKWIADLQNKYQLANIEEIYQEANKLYDGYFIPLIK